MREQAEGRPSVGRESEPATHPSSITECDELTPGRPTGLLRDYHAAFNAARGAMALLDHDGHLLAALGRHCCSTW